MKFVQETLLKKTKRDKQIKKKMHVVSLQLVPPLLSSNTMADFWTHEAFLSVS
jgi:hypothetical protein